MIGEEAIRAILSQYEKFGWKLGRVLLTDAMRRYLSSPAAQVFAVDEISSSDLNAAWFSRPSKDGSIAWELRTLDASPFALVEVVDADIERSELRGIMERTEQRLRERLQGHHRGH